MEGDIPDQVKDMVVQDAAKVDEIASQVDFVFSAIKLDKADTRALEEAYAKAETPVVSNNSAHRWTPDVPMVIPEVNPQHTDVIKYQKARLGTTRGFIALSLTVRFKVTRQPFLLGVSLNPLK